MTAARHSPLAPIVVEDVLALVGGTPLVRIRLLGRDVPEGRAEVWAKMEEANPAGSVKDRIAVAMIGSPKMMVFHGAIVHTARFTALD